MLSGKVKSFNPNKGFGFITSHSLTQDVFFGARDLPNVPQGTQLQGELVVFEAEPTPDGKVKASKMAFQNGQTAQRLSMGGMMGERTSCRRKFTAQ